MLSRGLSGADSPPPPADSPLRPDLLEEPPRPAVQKPPTTGAWPPGPPPMTGPPSSQGAGGVDQPDLSYGLEAWRHPFAIGRKELWESGFDFSRERITKAFETNGQTVRLGETDDTLIVNDVQISRASDDLSYLEITHGKTGESFSIAAPTWALAVALHDAYLEPLDPERSWQIGVIDEETVLFLARPEEIAAIARRSLLAIVADLAQLSPQ